MPGGGTAGPLRRNSFGNRGVPPGHAPKKRMPPVRLFDQGASNCSVAVILSALRSAGSAAFTTPGADTDKDERVSLLEAFVYAKREVARAYETDTRLATEHAMLDDDGDRRGSAAPDPRAGVREGLDGRDAGADPAVVGDPLRVVGTLEWHVQVRTDQDPLAGDVPQSVVLPHVRESCRRA